MSDRSAKYSFNAQPGGATPFFNFSTGLVQYYTFGAASATASFGPMASGLEYFVFVTQDSVGSRTMTWPSGIKWKGGSAPTLTTTGGKTDLIHFVHDGTSAYGWADVNF